MSEQDQLRQHITNGEALFEARDYEAAYRELSLAIFNIEEAEGNQFLPDEKIAELYILRGSALLSENGENSYADSDIFHQAITDFEQAIEIQPENTLYYNLRGRVYLLAKIGDFIQEAKQDFMKALELDADNLDAMKNLGEVLSREGNYDRAIYYLSRVLEQTGDAETFMMRGLCHFKKRPPAFDAAAYDFGEAQKLQPQLGELYIWRAQCFQELGETEAAIYEYDQLISIFPNKAGYYIDRGAIKHEIDPDGALEDYSHALSLVRHPLALNNRAVLLAERGNYEEAIEDAEAALEVDDSYTIAYATLAEIHARLGNKEKMYSFLELAVKYYYEDVIQVLETKSFAPYLEDEKFQEILKSGV